MDEVDLDLKSKIQQQREGTLFFNNALYDLTIKCVFTSTVVSSLYKPSWPFSDLLKRTSF